MKTAYLSLLLFFALAAWFSGLRAQDSPLNVEFRVGLGKNTLIGKDMPDQYYLKYPKTTGTFGIGASYRILSSFYTSDYSFGAGIA
ncbi:MAG: hypothetical protein RBS43_09325 [Candidatus Cloacimonas sp.]|jgi:hypothetical protein|nr:hypothetical protein [Candidatus Cloacimonas sp.]